jgi:beta-glucosidase
MKTKQRCFLLATVMAACLFLNSCKKWQETGAGQIKTVSNQGGQTLTYAIASDVRLITDGGFAFKDLNRNGKLDPYEDWRLSSDPVGYKDANGRIYDI